MSVASSYKRHHLSQLIDSPKRATPKALQELKGGLEEYTVKVSKAGYGTPECLVVHRLPTLGVRGPGWFHGSVPPGGRLLREWENTS